LDFELLPTDPHPIVPVMLHDAVNAQRFAAALLEAGVLATGFFYPVVPRGQARLRTQMSAALTTAQVDEAIAIFGNVGRQLEIIA
jgi:glycine C-acetyltransferase